MLSDYVAYSWYLRKRLEEDYIYLSDDEFRGKIQRGLLTHGKRLTEEQTEDTMDCIRVVMAGQLPLDQSFHRSCLQRMQYSNHKIHLKAYKEFVVSARNYAATGAEEFCDKYAAATGLPKEYVSLYMKVMWD